MFSPSTDELTTGSALSASIVALMTNGRNVSFAPFCASNCFFTRSRSRAMFVKSTSKMVVTCAETRRLLSMFSAILRRILLIGSMVTRSPAANAGVGVVGGAAGATAGAGAGAPLRCSMKLRMSSLVTRPPRPVPGISSRLTPCSRAMLRTRGDDRALPTASKVGAAAGMARACAGLPKPREHGIDRDRVALLRQNLGHHTGRRRRNFSVNLVGRNFQQRLVALHRVADLLQPFNNCSLSNGFAHLRHQDICGHSFSPKLLPDLPFSIFHITFVICHCRSSGGQAMGNDKCNMENGKWKYLKT